MSSRRSAEEVVRALIQASEYGPVEHPPAPARRGVTIAVSREAGSGGETVAQEVGTQLGWPVYDAALLTQLAKDLHVDTVHLEGVDERPGSQLVECLKAFAAALPVSQLTYFRGLLKLLLALGARGECVIVGRGATIVLPVATTLRVRVVATPADRIAAVARERGLDHDAAARAVETTDRERAHFVRAHFHKDPADPVLYDLVLNTSRFTRQECARIVVSSLDCLRARKENP